MVSRKICKLGKFTFLVTVGFIFGQMFIESRRVAIEQSRDIGLRQDVRDALMSDEREPRRRSMCVRRINGDRCGEGGGRSVEIAELLPRFAKREPSRRPRGRALERLLE